MSAIKHDRLDATVLPHAAYLDRQIVIVFNMLPLADNMHKLFIDIYSDMIFPKPILSSYNRCQIQSVKLSHKRCLTAWHLQ
jgi:hypothetical protein